MALVYGSPKSRELCGKKYPWWRLIRNKSGNLMRIFISKCEQNTSKKRGTTFCLEPLSIKETNDFITSLDDEVIFIDGEIVELVNHPNFKLHLDTKINNKVLFGEN